MNPRVAVAMSGGVDSSVAAALLAEQGYEVIGLSMLVASATDADTKERSCCSAEDFQDARRVAETVGFPHYVLNLQEEFRRKVINIFVEEYVRGRTPNPCTLCNRDVKFHLLWQRARELGAEYVATGHYARIERNGGWGRYSLLRGADQSKDQSYFLFALNQEQLARTLFPVGHLRKAQVREEARRLRLRIADKPESQEICFIPRGDYAQFIESQVTPEVLRAGEIVDREGHVIGCHRGIHRFTVGQRRGLGLSTSPHPLYVTAIDGRSGRVTVGPRDSLLGRGFTATGVNWVDGTAPGGAIPAQVKIRYRHPALASEVVPVGSAQARVEFLEGYPAITPGQAAVFYQGERVVGGGWIEGAL